MLHLRPVWYHQHQNATTLWYAYDFSHFTQLFPDILKILWYFQFFHTSGQWSPCTMTCTWPAGIQLWQRSRDQSTEHVTVDGLCDRSCVLSVLLVQSVMMLSVLLGGKVRQWRCETCVEAIHSCTVDRRWAGLVTLKHWLLTTDHWLLTSDTDQWPVTTHRHSACLTNPLQLWC